MRSRGDAFQLRGFTLIELMVVVSIVMLVLVWGVPNMLHGLEKTGMRKVVSDLMEGCEKARALAILTGEPAELIIRAEDGMMSIRKNAAPHLIRHEAYSGEEPDQFGEEAPVPKRDLASEISRFSRALGTDVGFEVFQVNHFDQTEFTEGLIRFHPNGTSDECTIKLLHVDEDGKTSRRLIYINPITGIPRMSEPEE